MARVVAFIPDLLFGSKVIAQLQAAGHQARLVAELPGELDAEVVVVDLTTDAAQRIGVVSALRGVHRVAFYSHVENDVRVSAQEAGFDLVVPRSRMAREGAALISRLTASH